MRMTCYLAFGSTWLSCGQAENPEGCEAAMDWAMTSPLACFTPATERCLVQKYCFNP
jgi:hypothetical protein